MKRLFILLFLCSLTAVMGAVEVPQVTNVLSRESMSLNGQWHYIVDVQEEGYYDYRMNPTRWGFFRNAKPQRPEDLIEYDFDKAATMQVPGDWNTQDEKLFFYEGTVWFKTSFQAQVPIENYRTILYFGAVNYDCRVWVNGHEAGHHVGGFTPFNFDVTEMLQNGENTVIVKVDNKRKAEAVPTQIFDWWNYGGITRDVLLVRVPPTYIENFKLQLEKADAKARQREITMTAQLNKPMAGQKLTLSIPELKVNCRSTEKPPTVLQSTIMWPTRLDSAPSKPVASSSCSTDSPSSCAASAFTRRKLTVADVPIAQQTPTRCSAGQRNLVATSSDWLTIRTTSMPCARLSVWESWCGRRFLFTGPLHGKTPKLTRMLNGN